MIGIFSPIFFAFFLVAQIYLIKASDLLLIRAQCESKCLHSYAQIKFSLQRRFGRVDIYKACFEDPSCASCMVPCSQPYSDFTSCQTQCKSASNSLLNQAKVSPFTGSQTSGNRDGASDSHSYYIARHKAKTSNEKYAKAQRIEKDDGKNSVFQRHSASLTACQSSCAFLKDITVRKAGTCPSIAQMSGFALACLDSCHKDGDCSGIQKCCAHRCGRTCQYPETINEVIPPRPIFSQIDGNLAKDSDGRTLIQLEWNMPDTFFSNEMMMVKGKSSFLNESSLLLTTSSSNKFSILYVLQSQMDAQHDKRHINKLAEWKDLIITSNRNMLLRDFFPSSWIRFRVASVNANGTMGYSEPSRPLTIKTSVNAPLMPANLTTGEYTIQPNGKISQSINWSPPYSDLPISKYKILWSDQKTYALSLATSSPTNSNSNQAVTAMKDEQNLHQHRKIVKGTLTSTILSNLSSDTTYFIQVQAYSQKGTLKFRGEKASIFLTTPRVEKSDLMMLQNQNIDSQPHSQPLVSSKPQIIYSTTEPTKMSPPLDLNNVNEDTDLVIDYVVKYDENMPNNGGDLKRQDVRNQHLKTKGSVISARSLVPYILLTNSIVNVSHGPFNIDTETNKLQTMLSWDYGTNKAHESENDINDLNQKIIYPTKLKITWKAMVCIEGGDRNSLNPTLSEREVRDETKEVILEWDDTNEENDIKSKSTLITGLKYQCRYRVHMEASFTDNNNQKNYVGINANDKLSLNKLSPMIKSPSTVQTTSNIVKFGHTYYFQTPSCQSLQRSNVNMQSIDCPSLVPLPSKPRDFSNTIRHISENNVTALLSWKAPLSSTENEMLLNRNLESGNRVQENYIANEKAAYIDPNIIGYRVVFYGKRATITTNPSSSTENGRTFTSMLNNGGNILIKVFSPLQTSYYVTDLLPERDYAADVQAFSESGPGEVSHIEFRTPKYHKPIQYVQPNAPFYGMYHQALPYARRHYPIFSHFKDNSQLPQNTFPNFKEPPPTYNSNSKNQNNNFYIERTDNGDILYYNAAGQKNNHEYFNRVYQNGFYISTKTKEQKSTGLHQITSPYTMIQIITSILAYKIMFKYTHYAPLF